MKDIYPAAIVVLMTLVWHTKPLVAESVVSFNVSCVTKQAACAVAVDDLQSEKEQAKVERAKSPPVIEYTKIWTDDYHNYNKVVYPAYTKALKDETGDEVTIEVWHGLATGYHKNGKKAWEVEYRNGKREGDFTSWADNGTKTATATFERGLVHGKRSQWNHDGRKMHEETCENGKANGETRYWGPDGKVVTTGTNRDGKPWEGTFPELITPPGESSLWVIRRYEAGKKVGEQKLTGNWWW